MKGNKQAFRRAMNLILIDAEAVNREIIALDQIIKTCIGIAGDEKATISERLDAVSEAREGIIYMLELRERALRDEYGRKPKSVEKQAPAPVVDDGHGVGYG